MGRNDFQFKYALNNSVATVHINKEPLFFFFLLTLDYYSVKLMDQVIKHVDKFKV